MSKTYLIWPEQIHILKGEEAEDFKELMTFRFCLNHYVSGGKFDGIIKKQNARIATQ